MMNMDFVLMAVIGIGCLLVLSFALAWTIKLTREIPSNFDALKFDDAPSSSKDCLWWK